MSKERVAIEVITPAIAACLLAVNEGNRSQRSKRVDALARDWASGHALLSNDAIVVTGPSLADPRRLLNGQHRCEAGLSTGVAFRSIVLFGANEPSREIMDVGGRRFAWDEIAPPFEKTKQAAATLVRAYTDGVLSVTGPSQQVSAREILETWRSHAGLSAACEFIPRLMPVAGSVAGVVASLALMIMADRASALAFAEDLASGAGIAGPELVLRERLTGSKGTSTRSATVAAWCVKAWNAKRTGTPLSRLTIREGESFPSVHGHPVKS